MESMKEAIKIPKMTEGIGSPEVCNAEITYMSLYSRVLDCFLFIDED